jgi:menaquinone-dependent protoporphyrinogen oxidase
MSKVLVVYGSKEGQTKNIAQFIARELESRKHKVDLLNTNKVPQELSIQSYDGVIAGAPLHLSNYPRHFRKFVSKYSGVLSLVQTSFFTVCLGVLENSKKTDADLKHIAEKLFIHSRWLPTKHETFAGAIRFSQYNWLTRLIMKRKAEKAGAKVDVHKDIEYTDWNKVRAFTEDFERHLPHSH